MRIVCSLDNSRFSDLYISFSGLITSVWVRESYFSFYRLLVIMWFLIPLMTTIRFISVRIHTTTLRRKFDDAQIFLEALDERCGAGTFILDDPKLFTPKGCPDIAATKTKKPMGRADIYWKAPKCGCVNIRYDTVILMCFFVVCVERL